MSMSVCSLLSLSSSSSSSLSCIVMLFLSSPSPSTSSTLSVRESVRHSLRMMFERAEGGMAGMIIIWMTD